MKAILKNGSLKYQTQYKVIYDLEGNQSSTIGATDEQWEAWGFKEVVEPIITENQYLGEYYETEITITRYVINKTPEVIAQELENRKAQAVSGYESDTDSLIRSVVGERSSEYEIAEQEAIVYKAAGYPDVDVPPSIGSDAIANNRTNTEACDLILSMATNWRTMQMALRANRLLAKANSKSATTLTELQTVIDTWNGFISYIKSQIVE